MKLDLIPQISDHPTKCEYCRKDIWPGEHFWRACFIQDGHDEFGKDYCDRCRELGKHEWQNQ